MAASSTLKMTRNKKKLHVYITVSGGVAYAADVPDSVEAHILDCDDLRSDRSTTLATYSQEEREFLKKLED